MTSKENKQILKPENSNGTSTNDYEAFQVHEASPDNSTSTSNPDEQPCQAAKSVDQSLTFSQKKIMLGMALASFLSGSLMAVMVPFFPVEAASRGVPQTTISAVFSCFAMTKMVLSPIVGRVAPIIGITRLYKIGLATAGVTTIMFGVLYHIGDTQLFVVACFVVRVAEAAGTTAVSGCTFTIIANQFPKHTSSVVALISAVRSVGQSLAPAVGSGLYAAAGFSLPFYVTGGAMVVVAALNHWFMPLLDSYQRRSVPYFSMLRVFSKSPENWLNLLNVFNCPLVFLTFDTSVAPYAKKVLGISSSILGLYFTVTTAAYVLTSFQWAHVAQRARHPYAIIGLGLLVVWVSLLLIPPSPLLGLAPRWWLLGLGMTLMEGSLGGAYIPCFQLMLAEGLRHGLPNDVVTQAFVSSVLSTVFSMGSVVGPPLGGLIVDVYGFPVMMTSMAGLLLLASLLNITYAVFAKHLRKEDKSSPAADNQTPTNELQSG